MSAGPFGLTGVPFLILHAGIRTYLWTAGAMLAVFIAEALWKTLVGREPSVEDGPRTVSPAGGYGVRSGC